MKVNQLKPKSDVSLVKQSDLWNMECSQVKPYHFGLLIRKHNRMKAILQCQRILTEMQKLGYLKDYELPPIYRCTIDELPMVADLPIELRRSAVEHMIPVDSILLLRDFRESLQSVLQSV